MFSGIEGITNPAIKDVDIRTRFAVRVIAISPDNQIPMVMSKDGWFGLPGGKPEIYEKGYGNFLSVGAFETLAREFREECGPDISIYLKNKGACLGLVDALNINDDTKEVFRRLTSVFVCKVPKLEYLPEVVQTDLFSDPGPLFPDARIALTYFRQRISRRIQDSIEDLIEPEFLNKKAIYFQTHPDRRYLRCLPDWV